jgi:mono/diheme cytochrome c family protein
MPLSSQNRDWLPSDGNIHENSSVASLPVPVLKRDLVFRIALLVPKPYSFSMQNTTSRLLMLIVNAGVIVGSLTTTAAGDYLKDIKPVLKARCFACHGALRQEAGLRLDSGQLMRTGGDSGPAVVSGSSESSLLTHRITATDADQRMPPQGEPLKPEQIDAIRDWIQQGAVTPPDEQPEADPRRHWAFLPPVRPEIPETSQPRHPIDALIEQELTRQGLTAAPVADKTTLLKRAYIDLVGLPPGRDEQHQFLQDSSATAWPELIDRLLASPQYGERWARHWMDVWRYSDWYGRRSVLDVMNSYPTIWRWRDWIVRSLNQDKGYDQMVVEMLAGDEIAPDDQETVAATGFIVRNWFKWNRDTWMRDQVEHTGKAFLGLWFQCSLCHDHKYDPISQHEYFQLRAIFEPLELRHDRVPGEPDPGPHKAYVYGASYGPISSGMVRVFDHQPDAETRIYRGGDQRNIDSEIPAVAVNIPEFFDRTTFSVKPLELPVTSWYPGLRAYVQAEETATRQKAVDDAQAELQTALAATAGPLSEATRTAAEAKLAAATSELESWKSRTSAETARYITNSPDYDQLAASAAASERRSALLTAVRDVAAAELAAATAEALPAENTDRAAKIQKAEQQRAAALKIEIAARDALSKTDSTYSPLSPIYSRKSTGRRTALASWITDRNNPLAARVAVNHIWNWHFGRPLVDTTSNFGRNGRLPSHPELLDWLAVEFMEHGWSQKHLHRLIMTSDTWRRSSSIGSSADHPELKLSAERDPENRFLWRGHVQRMEAESVRDAILAVSGQLDLTQGGPELEQSAGLTSRRRSLYFSHHGETRMEFLELFDAPSTLDCYRRTTSVLPQQALALSNSELTREQSRLLAAKLRTELSGSGSSATSDRDHSDRSFVTAAFEQILSRSPSSEESTAALAFMERQRKLYETSGDIQKSEQSEIEPSHQRSYESLVHALLNHNDFLTVR